MHKAIHFDHIADLYDYYVNADFDLRFFLEEATKVQGKVLELTSGTGRLSIPLLQAGVDLTCVDYSEAMLGVLSRKLEQHRLSCRVIPMDITELSLDDRFALIFIPFHSFSEILEPQKQKSALEHIREHLTETGEFICTLHNPVVRTHSMDGTLHRLGKFPTVSGGSLIVNYEMHYAPSSPIAYGKQFYEVYDELDNLTSARELDINFYVFTKHEFDELVRETGFEISDLYGNYDWSPFDHAVSPFMIWRLRKSTPRA